MPTGQTIYTMALNLFSDTILSLKAYDFEGFLKWNQIDGMVINH